MPVIIQLAMKDKSELVDRHWTQGSRPWLENLSPSAVQYSYWSRSGSRLPASMAFFSGSHAVSISHGEETRFEAFGKPYTQISTEYRRLSNNAH